METQNYAKCATCGTTEKLLRCAKCKTIFYCSTAHQHMDWPRHKAECRILSKQLATYNVTATSVVTPATVPTQPNGFIINNLQQNNELQENDMLMQQMHIGINPTNLASGLCGVDGVGDEINNLNVNNRDINSFNKLPDQEDAIVQQKQQDQAAEYVPQFSTQANNQLEKSSSYQIRQVDDTLLGNVK